MKARSFDKAFDSGEDVTKYLDLSRARRPRQEQKRVNVDFPRVDDPIARQRSEASWRAAAIAD